MALCISSITLAELPRGAENRRSRRRHDLISTIVDSVQALAFDQSAGRSVRHRRDGVRSAWRADRDVRHPHDGARSLAGLDVCHEQHSAFRLSRWPHDGELGVRSWVAAHWI